MSLDTIAENTGSGAMRAWRRLVAVLVVALITSLAINAVLYVQAETERKRISSTVNGEIVYQSESIFKALYALRNGQSDSGTAALDFLILDNIKRLGPDIQRVRPSLTVNDLNNYFKEYYEERVFSDDLAFSEAIQVAVDRRRLEIQFPPNLKIGQAVPDLSVTTSDGNSVALRPSAGKVLLLTFYATWCGPCMEELAHFNQDLVARFPKEAVQILAIGCGETPDEVVAVRKQMGIKFAMASDNSKDITRTFLGKGASPISIPANCIIGSDGTLLFRSQGYSSESYQQLIAALHKFVDGGRE